MTFTSETIRDEIGKLLEVDPSMVSTKLSPKYWDGIYVGDKLLSVEVCGAQLETVIDAHSQCLTNEEFVQAYLKPVANEMRLRIARLEAGAKAL